MTDFIQVVFTMDDVKISAKDNKNHITGKPLNVKADIYDKITAADLMDFSKCDDSHLYRVITGEADPERESNYISISTGYGITVGVEDESGRAAILGDTTDVMQFRGRLKVKAVCKVLQHTEKGKTKYYLTLYPGVIVLPHDWRNYLFDPFAGM